MSELELQKICLDHTEKCMTNNIKPFIKNLDKINENLISLPSKLESRFDKRYADKQTQKDVAVIKADIRRVVWMILGVVILGLLSLILK